MNTGTQKRNHEITRNNTKKTQSFCVASCAFVVLFFVLTSYAVGVQKYVGSSQTAGSVNLVSAPIITYAGDYPGVLRAARDLQEDFFRVSGVKPPLLDNIKAAPDAIIIIGTIGKSPLIDQLIASGKLDATDIRGKWEASVAQVVNGPLPGINRALVIAGSDKRGTIYGIYDLSENIGVSPWYWWADVPVKKSKQLFARGGRYVRQEPKVKYRGIFINDEAPALQRWSEEKFGGVNSKMYAHVFELILRLRGNYLWPAMWGNAFYDDDPANGRLADDYGIVIGTSHHEPLQRAHDEWRRYGNGGAWDYTKNAEQLRAFWTEGVRRAKGFESIITLGMRGDGDSPMSREANTELLERIVADQRKIIAENVNPDVTKVPQMWALYKEVQEYYEKGMRVPDDVTLLWCDDNWGNIRRLPTPEERNRPGGAGIYYHFDYVGGPRSYKWLNTNPIPKVWEQMDLAYRYGADRVWIVNVGDIKPVEFPIEFFLDMAWEPERWKAKDLGEYTRQWAEREFGKEHSAEIAGIVSKYGKYNGRRKPEQLEPTTFSLVNYHEAETVLADWKKIAADAERIYKVLPLEKRAAFYQLVLHPVISCANLNEIYVAAGRNRLYGTQGRASTNEWAAKVRELFRRDAEISRYYNQVLSGGKWSHMMDQTHIGATTWQDPVVNIMPGVQEVLVPAKAEMGIAFEGLEFAIPNNFRQAALPPQNVYDKRGRYIELFNRGSVPFKYSIEVKEPWIRVSETAGTIVKDTRIEIGVDWNAAPRGETRGTITLNGPSGRKLPIAVPIVNPDSPRPETLDGFVETNGYVSIEAEHTTQIWAERDFFWTRLPDFGRTLSGMGNYPATARPRRLSRNSAHLEYKMYLFKTGEISVDTIFAPTQNFLPGDGFRFAVSFDDDEPQVINFHAGYDQQAWNRSVSDAVRVMTSKHTIRSAGYHTLKIWAIDPGLVLQKIVVNTGGVRPSYLGPPESFNNFKRPASE